MSTRAPYHHGDLRNALALAAADLAERGGPDAVTIRAAAREVGVTPTAAYRHFANHDDLLGAAKEQSMTRMNLAMRARLDSMPAVSDPVDEVIARLEAVGRGYVDFALSEPGLFRTAFCRGRGDGSWREDEDEDAGPHAMLVRSIDNLVALGFLPEAQRLGAEIGAWSLVHGLAMLLLDGPLAALPSTERGAVIDQTLRSFTQTFWNARQALASEAPGRRR